MRYLLPCTKCGQKLPVDAGWAGQTLTCQCGQTLEIPSVRHLRHLEPLDDGPPAPLWTRRHGLIFVGSVIAVGALVFGGYLVMSLPRPFNSAAIRQEVNDLAPAECFVRSAFVEPSLAQSSVRLLQSENVPPHLSVSRDILLAFQAGTPYLAPREAAELQKRLRVRKALSEWIPLAAGLAAVGVLIALSALLVGKSQPRARRPATPEKAHDALTAGNKPH